MSRMSPASGNDLLRIFKLKGWKVIRIKGSHHIMMKDNSFTTLTVPVHKGQTLPKGTQRALIKDAGLTIDEFNSLL